MNRLISLLIVWCLAINTWAAPWAPAGDRIKTKWAEDVSPENVHPEYPRPQMVRPDWMNLNGLWNYAITPKEAISFEAEGQILVPFCVESSLSGVGRTLEQGQALWYERSFTIPSKWKGKKVMLHFGAVDWQTDVWLNGTWIGSHSGGYTPFSFDITPHLEKGSQTLRIRVYDQTDLAWQPRGKQVAQPNSIWYTAVTGIWQTVWLEPVPEAHITDYNVVSDIDNASMNISVVAENLGANDVINVELINGCLGYSAEAPGSNVIASTVAEDGKATVQVPDMKLWSPSRPYLYGLRLSIVRKGKVIDSVNAYTAMRKIARMDANDKRNIKNCDGKSFHCMALNNAPLFQMGPLDQGWWPDGLYTAPTDEALRYDIIKTKEWGFNMIRKHIKVEPARWFYWCDAIGIMVWQDMPCIADHSMFRKPGKGSYRGEELNRRQVNQWNTMAPATKGTDCDVPQEWKQNYYKEWSEIIAFAKKFPCVVVWVPFNEAWGQFDTEKVVAFTREQDGTRLINESSGGNYHFAGDIMDCHRYPSPAMPFFDIDKINVIGEYGGIGFVEDGHIWNPDINNWGYNGVKASHDEVTDTYADFVEMLKVYVRTGVCAAVYTQTTDVEGEVNGLMTYDRKVVKIDEERVRKANESVINSLK